MLFYNKKLMLFRKDIVLPSTFILGCFKIFYKYTKSPKIKGHPYFHFNADFKMPIMKQNHYTMNRKCLKNQCNTNGNNEDKFKKKFLGTLKHPISILLKMHFKMVCIFLQRSALLHVKQMKFLVLPLLILKPIKPKVQELAYQT